jgi:hypothetical protein
MRTTVELPDSVYRKGERMARAEGVTMEEFIVRTLERELTSEPELSASLEQVSLPLVRSKHPGTLDLEDFNFDDLLA